MVICLNNATLYVKKGNPIAFGACFYIKISHSISSQVLIQHTNLKPRYLIKSFVEVIDFIRTFSIINIYFLIISQSIKSPSFCMYPSTIFIRYFHHASRPKETRRFSPESTSKSTSGRVFAAGGGNSAGNRILLRNRRLSRVKRHFFY